MVAYIHRSWLAENNARAYPIAETATRKDDNGKPLPDQLLCDLRIFIRNTALSSAKIFLASYKVSKKQVLITLAAKTEEDSFPIAVIEEKKADPFCCIPLKPLLTGIAGSAVIGNIVNNNEMLFGHFSTPEQSQFVETCIDQINIPGVEDIHILNKQNINLSTGKTITFSSQGAIPLQITAEEITYESQKQPAVIFTLDTKINNQAAVTHPDLNFVESYPGKKAIYQLNTVKPDECGVIHLVFDDFYTYVAPSTLMLDTELAQQDVCKQDNYNLWLSSTLGSEGYPITIIGRPDESTGAGSTPPTINLWENCPDTPSCLAEWYPVEYPFISPDYRYLRTQQEIAYHETIAPYFTTVVGETTIETPIGEITYPDIIQIGTRLGGQGIYWIGADGINHTGDNGQPHVFSICLGVYFRTIWKLIPEVEPPSWHGFALALFDPSQQPESLCSPQGINTLPRNLLYILFRRSYADIINVQVINSGNGLTLATATVLLQLPRWATPLNQREQSILTYFAEGSTNYPPPQSQNIGNILICEGMLYRKWLSLCFTSFLASSNTLLAKVGQMTPHGTHLLTNKLTRLGIIKGYGNLYALRTPISVYTSYIDENYLTAFLQPPALIEQTYTHRLQHYGPWSAPHLIFNRLESPWTDP